MKQVHVRMYTLLVLLVFSLLSHAQQSVATAANATNVVPPLIQFSNVATDEGGNSLSGVVSITFSLYSSQSGGEPLWAETQNNVQLDPTGHYSVQLGITKPSGVPTTLFTTGEARWLGVRIAEQAQQPRVLFLSVPYALKAGDAATIGGLPPSAFVLAAPPLSSAVFTPQDASATGQNSAPPPAGTITGTGTVNFLPLWDSTSDIISSVLFQSGSGNTAKIGINTTTPATTLDVKGGGTIRGTLSLPATGTATATAGKNSQPQNLVASAFNSSTSKAASQTFQWQAEPAGNDTTTPAGTLNLLFGEGTAKPSETGLNIASNGQVTFAQGQIFPGTGDGTVTSVAAGAGLAGGTITSSGTLSIANGGVTNGMLVNPSLTLTAGTDLTGGGLATLGGNVTLNLDTTKVPQLNAANTFTGNQTVSGNLSATGVVTGSSYQIGSNLFAFGSFANGNAFLGFAGNTTMTGGDNIATGTAALINNTTGSNNTAVGPVALSSNTAGNSNTAIGEAVLVSNTTGGFNTGDGAAALSTNTTGSLNTAVGSGALGTSTGSANTGIGFDTGNTADGSKVTGNNNTALGASTVFSTGTLTNATAIGANAEVAESNAMVLGSINGVNTATASTNVGIGITAPKAALDVAGNGLDTYIGNPGCNSGSFAGIAFGTSGFASGCTNSALVGDNTGNTYLAAPTGDIVFRLNNNGVTAMKIVNDGVLALVGINTTSPDANLSVNGSADKPGGGSWGTFSDGRLKNLNGSFNSGLSQVLKLHPVRYRYKPDNAMGIRDLDEHIGLVAQDVQRVIPEAVTENNKGYLLVNNDPIIWTMLNAIKEQQREIKQQQNLLRAQAAAMRNLKAEVRETRETLRKVKAQVAAARPALVAAK